MLEYKVNGGERKRLVSKGLMSSTTTTEEEKEGFHAGVEWGKGMRAGVVSLIPSLEEKSSPSIELRRDIPS